jgi:superfamily II DNA or RNA helicase
MITVIIDNELHLIGAEGQVVKALRDRLSFGNPKWEENERQGFSNWQTPRELCFLEKHGNVLSMPRGFARQLIKILKYHHVRYELKDRRRTLAAVDFHFKGELRDYQIRAVETVASRDFGVLTMPPGAGKTTVALSLVARRKQPTLVIVPTRELLNQWVDRIENFLGIPVDQVGTIGGGKMKVGKRITVGTVQTLIKCAQEVAKLTGYLIVDEAHHTPAKVFSKVVGHFDCRYMTGLSGTPYRRDGLGRLIWWSLGDLIYTVDKADLEDQGHILAAMVTWRKTSFEPTYNPSKEYSRMLCELTEDPARNALIADDIAGEAGNGGGVCLVLTDRKAHVETLAGLLEDRGIEAARLTGDLSNRERRQVVKDLNFGEIRVLVSTSQLLSEGFDCRELSTLFLCTPIRFSGRLLQAMGRILRPGPGKDRATVFDYVDVKVGVLKKAARGRARVYGG